MIYLPEVNQLVTSNQANSKTIELKEKIKINQYLNGQYDDRDPKSRASHHRNSLVYPLVFNIHRNSATGSFKLYTGMAKHEYLPRNIWIKMNDYKVKEVEDLLLMRDRSIPIPFKWKTIMSDRVEGIESWAWIPNSSLATNSFSKLHNMTIGMDGIDDRLNLGMIIDSKEHDDKVQLISSNDEIKFSYFENFFMDYYWVFVKDSAAKAVKPVSQSFTFKPEKLDLVNGNKVIGRIFCKTREEALRVLKNGIKPVVKHYSSSAYASKNLHTHAKLNKTPIQTSSGEYEIGKVLFDEFTYFDYDKQKSIIGYKKESRKRELVPHNYSGSYERNLVISFNSIYKDIDIHIVDEISKPILHKDGDGIFQLHQVKTPKEIYESTKMKHWVKKVSKEIVKEIPKEPKKSYWQEYLINPEIPIPL